MGSVVYVGRDSFRMEAIDLSLSDEGGVVQPIVPVTTSPYGIPAGEEGRIVIELDRAASSASWRAPSVPSLFGSQVDVPLLAAPEGRAELAPPDAAVIAISRVGLAGLAALVFATGLAAASLVMQPRPATTVVAPPVAVAPPAVAAHVVVEPTPVAPMPVAAEPIEPMVEQAPTISVAAPVTIRAPRKLVVRRAAPPPAAETKPSSKPWVDPFAE